MTADLRTRYLGLDLRSPLVASASPMTGNESSARLLDEAGIGAIVLPSLFEEEVLNEEIQLNRSLEAGSEQFAESLSYFPNYQEFIGVGERYLDHLAKIKGQVSVPVIASLNATTLGGWVRYAALMQEAGADALEVNLYRVAADPRRTANEIEAADLALVAAVRETVTIPVAVKLSPFYTSFAGFAGRMASLGVDGLVVFNRFYQPDLDLSSLDVVARVELSRSADLRLPMRWIGILRPQLPQSVSLAATSGVHTGGDVVKAVMVGADVAMMTSALLIHGPGHVRTVEGELRAWMEEHEYDSVAQMRGSATQAAVGDPDAYERANYMQTIHSWATPSALGGS